MKKTITLMTTILMSVLCANASEIPQQTEDKIINFEADYSNSSINYYSSDNDWYVTLKDGDGNKIDIDYISFTFDGTFTIDDCIQDYTRFADSDFNYDYFTSLEMTVTGASDKNYEITGTATGESGTKYHFHVLKNVITPVKTIQVKATVTDAVINDDGYTTFHLSSDTEPGVSYQIRTASVKGVRGTISTKDIVKESTTRVDADGNVAKFNSGTIRVDATKDYVLNETAKLVMTDSVEYDVTFSYQIPVKETRDVTVTNCDLNTEYLEFMGIYWFQGSNDEYTVKATCNPSSYDVIEQDYTDQDIHLTVTDNATQKEVDMMILNSAHQTLDAVGKPVIEATFLGNDCIRYNVNMSYVIPDKKGDKEFTFEGLTFSNLLSQSTYQIMGYDADSTHYASIAVYSDNVPGEYSIEDGTIEPEYSYFIYFNKSTGGYTEINFTKGNATVTMDETGKINVSAVLFGDDGYDYHLTMTSQYEKAHKQYDAEDADIDAAYTVADCDTIYYDEENGCAQFSLVSEERSDMFSMVIYSDDSDPVTIVPEGTYEINDSYESPSVQPGVYQDEELYPSFYGTFNEQGYIVAPVWFLTEGTVTISNNNGELSFEVNGRNSFDRTVHILYNASPVGIKTVDSDYSANAWKVMENGRIVIKKDNRVFSIGGQILK